VLCVGSLKAYVYDQVLPYAAILAGSFSMRISDSVFAQSWHPTHIVVAWAARYNAWLLIKVTPKGVVFSCSFLFHTVVDNANSQIHGWLREVLEAV